MGIMEFKVFGKKAEAIDIDTKIIVKSIMHVEGRKVVVLETES